MPDFVLCSNCFKDEGLRLSAEARGIPDISECPNCRSEKAPKLTKELVAEVAHAFFVFGSLQRCEYGGAPRVQFNAYQSTSIDTPPWLEPDVRLIERTIQVGFFYYGPRLWMIGEVQPLKDLQKPRSRRSIIERILAEYPTTTLRASQSFYRLRKDPRKPEDPGEYDSPPLGLPGKGRFDASDFPVMYGSQELQVCLHECRVTSEDELYIATLLPTCNLELLHLGVLLKEEVTEFESLDMAVHMLFLAGKHSYPVTRDLARAAQSAGYHGIIYPSYFSLLLSGGMPFETVWGISHRRIPQLQKTEESKLIPNLALFGRPIADGRLTVRCINRLVINSVAYGFELGPVCC
jgi:hypothetical protein